MFLRFLSLLTLSLCFTLCQAQRDSFRLIWQEDFDTPALDTTHWRIIGRVGYTEWAKYMSSDPRLYALSKGRLRLYALANDHGQVSADDTAKFLTGGISTLDKFSFRYGRVEVRARIHGAQGCWPAIWMKAVDRNLWGYPGRAEIDLIEYYNHDKVVHQTIHTNYTDIDRKTTEHPNHIAPKIQLERWNTYAVDILPRGIIFYVNGYRTLFYPNLGLPKSQYQYTFGVDSYLMLDMQVGNPWLMPNPKDYPAYMDIDWVKVYEY